MHSIPLPITGTYKANEYVSGNDIIMYIDDYYKFFARISITDEENHFKRIGEIYPKEVE
jgi:hypothetical protein